MSNYFGDRIAASYDQACVDTARLANECLPGPFYRDRHP
jgi:hypothetical protein